MTDKVKLGQHVVYVDPVGRDIPALVTAVWSEHCINVVFVSLDESKGDTYGRQIERETSCTKGGPTTAYGRYWRFEGEEKIPITPALQK